MQMRTISQILKQELEEAARACGQVDEKKAAAADRMLETKARGGKVILCGCGTSGAAAKKIAHTLNCVEIPAVFLSPADAVHGGLGIARHGDTAILISKGGNTEELVRLMPVLKEKETFLIGVSEDEASRIACGADLFLKTEIKEEPCPLGMLATASTITVIALFDAIAIHIMEKSGYTREQFHLIHPGGAVGEKLAGGR